MKTMRCVGTRSLFIGLALSWTQAAAAQPNPDGWTLEWSRSAEAAGCPGEAALAGAVARTLGKDPFAAAASRRIAVAFAREAGAWSATVRRIDAAGNERGRQQLTSPSDDCRELFDATVAALAVLIGGTGREPGEPSAGSETEEPAPATVKGAAPSAAAGEARAPSATSAATPSATTASPEPSPAVTDTRPRQRPTNHSIGLSVAYDGVIQSSVTPVCPSDQFRCDGAQGVEAFDSSRGNEVFGGLLGSTVRLLLEYEHRVTARIGVLGRAGIVVGHRATEALPVHLEVSARYWLGADPRKIRAFVAAGAGWAGFDATVPVEAFECLDENYGGGLCVDGRARHIEAVRLAGDGFVAASVGGLFRFTPRNGVLLRGSVRQTFPHSATVIEPSIGYARSW